MPYPPSSSAIPLLFGIQIYGKVIIDDDRILTEDNSVAAVFGNDDVVLACAYALKIKGVGGGFIFKEFNISVLY